MYKFELFKCNWDLTVKSLYNKGLPIGLVGYGILHFVFAVISEFELKIGVGSGNYNYEREEVFVLLWGWVAWFARGGTERDTGFQFLRDFVNWKAQKLQADRNEPTVRIHMCQISMQAMNSNGSVTCHVLSNVSIIARLRKYYEIVWPHLCWPQTSMISLVSEIFEACVYNLDTSIDVRTGMPSFGKTSSEPRFQESVKRVHNRVLRYRFPAEFLMIILPFRRIPRQLNFTVNFSQTICSCRETRKCTSTFHYTRKDLQQEGATVKPTEANLLKFPI